MGVDVSSIMAFGTDNEKIGEKIVSILRQEDKNGESLKYYITGDIEESDGSLTPEQQEIVKDFDGFELWENCYSDAFEGFGIEDSPNSITDEDKSDTIALFKKYNLGEPEWVSFSHWW